MNSTTNILNWFEIPVTDLARAKHFYQVIFGIHLEESSMADMDMAMFPYDPYSGKVSGALVRSDYHRPSLDGALIYLNANSGMEAIIERIKDEHGEVVMEKTLISPEIGYMAFFVDTEGNRVALHSNH